MKQPRFPVFAERFMQLRGEMSQEEFARKVGLSRPTVSFYESGERLPDVLKLRQIAEKCRVSADWLVGLSNTKSLDAQVQEVCKYTGLAEDVVEDLHVDLGVDPKAHFISELIAEIILTMRWHQIYVATETAAVAQAVCKCGDNAEVELKDVLHSVLSPNLEGFPVDVKDCAIFYESRACKFLQDAVQKVVRAHIDELSQNYAAIRKMVKDGVIREVDEEEKAKIDAEIRAERATRREQRLEKEEVE